MLLYPSLRAFALAAIALCLAAGTAAAFELTGVTPSRDESGQLWVHVRIVDPIEPRVERSLERGMPATLQLHAELWRRRTAWFDRMEHAIDASMRVRYDVWNDAWRLERVGAPPLVVRSLDSLEIALTRTLALPVANLASIPGDARCYVVVTAALRPLNVEDVEEVEGWLSGEVQDRKRSGFGIITGLPRSLFDAVRNFAGFGDQRTHATTPDFTPDELAPTRR